MKKNVIFRIAAIVLMCTLVTACFASSTFAKYTSEVTAAENSAVVAKWQIEYKGDDLNASPAPTVNFDIFKTINHHHANDVQTKVAPGTWGQFTIAKIDNKSDVTAKITVKVDDVTTNNIPITFYETKGGTDDNPTFSNPITIAANELLVNETVAPNASTTAKTIYWAWEFGDPDNNTSDTAIGTSDAARAGTLTYDITLSIDADQLDK